MFSPIKSHIEYYQNEIRARGITPLQAALTFVLTCNEIDVVLCGVNTGAQLKEILRAEREEIKSLDSDFFSSFSLNEEKILNPSQWERS